MGGGGSMCFVICSERQSHRGDKRRRDHVNAAYCDLEYQYQHQ
jgi:hypothetical protein